MESLVGLRSELQRKREEALAASAAPTTTRRLKLKSTGGSSVPPAPTSSNRGVSARAARDTDQQEEQRAAAGACQSVLEQKAELYDKLKGGVEVLEDDALNASFLVNFQKKIVDTVLEEKKKREAAAKNAKKTAGKKEETQIDEGDPKDWVEHVDALGRSREVRRGELSALQEEDRYLRGEQDQTALETLAAAAAADAETATVSAEKVSELQEEFEEDYKERQRTRWEKKEEINANKKDLHYQDVMFDEARSHGVGFLRLSGDTDQRSQQQQLLRELHSASEAAAREHRAQQRGKEKSMAARLARVRQRKRLKRGLPMTDSDSRLKTPPPSDEEHSGAEDAAEVEAKPRPSAGVREWDVGKQIIGKFVEPADKDPDAFARKKSFLPLGQEPSSLKNLLGGPAELTQEAWLDGQRRGREAEFAPPSSYRGSAQSKRSRAHDDDDRTQRRYNSQPTTAQDIANECTSSSYSSFTSNKHRNDPEMSRGSGFKSQRKGTEIAPPALFDYYGPSAKRRPQSNLFDPMQTMDDAITKALKKLKDQTCL